MSQSTIRIEPSQMVLPAGFKQELKVTITPTEKEVSQCEDEASIVACVALFTGDEASRIKYKKCVQYLGFISIYNHQYLTIVERTDLKKPWRV